MVWPRFEPDEIEAAAAVLRSGRVNYWTGEQGRAFEREFAAAHAHQGQTPHAIALANGTVAIELALWALGVDGGEVIVPSRTFVATASAARMRGATPIFADVDLRSGNVTAESVAAVLSPRTRAVIVVHLAGWPCEMDPLLELCSARGIPLLEDCAQAHGARYRGRPVGTMGTFGCFSFCQDKIITTAGEGGMVLTDDEARYELAWSLKDHGKDYERVFRREHPPGFRWLHARLGTNWRLSEVQAAVGRRQLAKLDDFVAHRRRLAAIYDRRFSEVEGLRVEIPAAHLDHAYYKYYVYLDPSRLCDDWSRDRILAEATQRGVVCGSGSCSEIYLEDAFDASLRPTTPLVRTQELGRTSMMFLLDPTVGEDDVHRTCDVVSDLLRHAIR